MHTQIPNRKCEDAKWLAENEILPSSTSQTEGVDMVVSKDSETVLVTEL